ncbi:MAG TPA: TlpA disulfide reductase family protein [Burkholderiales bacterium]
MRQFLTLLFAAATFAVSGAAFAFQPGDTVPIPELKTIDGKTITPAELKGKLVVIEYWASWCPFCQKQIPYFQKLYNARAKDGLVVIGLNIENDVAKARGFVDTRKLTFPVSMTSDAIDKQLQRPKGLPITYVIGRDGKLLRLDKGELFEEDVSDIGELIAPKK